MKSLPAFLLSLGLTVAILAGCAACVPGWPRTIDIHIAASPDGGARCVTEAR